MASSSTPFLIAPSRRFWRDSRASVPCVSRPMARISSTATSGTQATGPPISQTMPMNSSTNGRSLMVAAVVDVKNSRTDSNSRTWLLNAPMDAGLDCRRICSTWLNSSEDRCRSSRLPTTSSMCERRLRSTNSNTMASTAPVVSSHSVSNALLGTTRS